MELPEAVRARLVSLVAASLGDVTPLPAALKQVAGFAPARRARLGAAAIMAELERDDELRERVAIAGPGPGHGRRRRRGRAGLAGALRGLAGRRTPRPRAGAPSRATAASRSSASSGSATAPRRPTGRCARQRRSHKAALDALKAEVSTLRRTLGETRTKERAAREEAEAARSRAEETAARLERELRQLRAQVTKLEEQAGEQRRQTRSDRDEVTIRARLLLETINDAAVGLRRELGLPSVSGNPGDRVEAPLADEGTREPTLDRVDGAEQPGPARAVPRAAQVPPDHRRLQRHQGHLADASASRRSAPGCSPCCRALVARTNAEATVVFDAAASETRPVVASPRGVKVLFSPVGVIADDVIRDLVAAEPAGRVVVVVTEDRELADDVRRAGARVVAPGAP